jgi:hypothetical protein
MSVRGRGWEPSLHAAARTGQVLDQELVIPAPAGAAARDGD